MIAKLSFKNNRFKRSNFTDSIITLSKRFFYSFSYHEIYKCNNKYNRKDDNIGNNIGDNMGDNMGDNIGNHKDTPLFF